jgi:hypothetical protein
MQPARTIFNSKIRPLIVLFLLLCCFRNVAFAQQTPDTPITNFVPQPPPDKKPKPIIPLVTANLSGRVLGVNLENVSAVTIINYRSDEKTLTNSNGIFQLTVAKGDTLTFKVGKYSKGLFVVRSLKEKINVILIKRKTDGLTPGVAGYAKANREDEELLRILEKDAKLEGKWDY